MSNDSSTLKELLDLIEKSEKEKINAPSSSKIKDSTVDRFIKEFNLRSGLDKIGNDIIYFYYKVKLKGSFKLRRVPFFRELSKHFAKTRVGKRRYYLMDGTSFDLSRETREEARLYCEEINRATKRIKTRRIKVNEEKKERKKQQEKTGARSNNES